MQLDTLDDFEREIDRLAADPLTGPVEDCGPAFGSRAAEVAYGLRDLSVRIRRVLWNRRKEAMGLADRADEAAAKIEAEHNLMGGRFNRWDASYSPCSGWSRAIQ